MTRYRKVFRRLLVEQLSERTVFSVDAMQVMPDLLFDEAPAATADHETHESEHEHDHELPLQTPDGHKYYYDPPVDPEVAKAYLEQLKLDPNSIYGSVAPANPPSGLDVPIYHSNPSYTKKIYLDFDGHIVTGTHWNNQNYTGSYNTGATINAPAFSLDSDFATFNGTELALIQEVWARVSEDYAPFQVDVTTEAPPLSQFTAGSQAIRVVISTNIDATTGQQWYPNAGGVAYLNSWTYTNGSPCWVFYNYMFGVPKYFADAASHEVGHTFNLGHDGRSSPSEVYYNGHGSGATNWGPIMGSGYYASVGQWSKGEYTSANNTQDDLAILSSRIPYIPDDHGNTAITATQLNVGTASTLAASGLITTRTDVDAIRFATQAGSITLNVNPFDYSTGKANLDAKLTVLDSTGAVVGSVDEVNVLNATLTVSVPKGFYTMLVDGSGRPAIPGDDGYSDYASIGKYTVSGTIVANAAPTPVVDVASVTPSASILIDVLGNDSDPNNDTLSILSVATPAAGTAVIEAGKIRYTASATTGQFSFAYTVIDELGVSTSSNIDVTVGSANTPPMVNAASETVTSNEGVALTQTGTWSDANATDVVTLSASSGNIVKNNDGTWSWSLTTTDDAASTLVTITADDGQGGTTTTTFSYVVTNLAPTVSVNNASVSGVVLSTLANTGNWSDVAADTVTLSTTAGVVVKNSDGTWSWSITPASIVIGQVITVTASDEDGGSSNISFTLAASAAVVSRAMFYNGSQFETISGLAAATEANKVLLQSSNVAQTTSFANVSTYSRGINGVVLNLAGLPSTTLTAADFIFRRSPVGASGAVVPANWLAAPAPTVISATAGTASSPGQIVIEWTDNAIQDTWLQIIVRPNANTGLSAPAVFYFGSVPGDINGATPYRIVGADLSQIQAAISNALVGIGETRDINKDRRITGADYSLVQARISNTVRLNNITIPVAGSADEGANPAPIAPPILASKFSEPTVGRNEAAMDLALLHMTSPLLTSNLTMGSVILGRTESINWVRQPAAGSAAASDSSLNGTALGETLEMGDDLNTRTRRRA